MRRDDANNRCMTDSLRTDPANAAPARDARWLAPSGDFFRPMLELAQLALVD